jgi:hypothetical protein
MEKIFVKQHMGLGDNIVHNGMVRKISEENPNCEIIVPTHHHNVKNVARMFLDNKNIIVEGFDSHVSMENIVNKRNYKQVISSCLLYGSKYSYGEYFDDAFYLQIGMSPKIKKDYFFLQRDEKKENEVFNQIVTEKGIKEYIFLHEKQKENIIINRNKIPNLPIVYADPNYDFFDLMMVIENAKECHLVSSSFVSLMTCKKFNPNIYVHMYVDRIELANHIKKTGLNVII